MNANELADYLQNKAEVELQPRLQESATMLRQQQAEIENLKAGLLSHYDIHPVKELTDEEITELENALKACDYKYFGSYAFTDKQWDAFEVLEKHAKAILRKASEK